MRSKPKKLPPARSTPSGIQSRPDLSHSACLWNTTKDAACKENAHFFADWLEVITSYSQHTAEMWFCSEQREEAGQTPGGPANYSCDTSAAAAGQGTMWETKGVKSTESGNKRDIIKERYCSYPGYSSDPPRHFCRCFSVLVHGGTCTPYSIHLAGGTTSDDKYHTWQLELSLKRTSPWKEPSSTFAAQ